MPRLPGMTNPPITELTARAREIFRLVVEGYIATGHPVGSKVLAAPDCRRFGAEAVAGLDPLGARRSRTPRAARRAAHQRRADADRGGLRLFVDAMMQVAEPTSEERAAIERRLAAPGPIEAALEATSAILSGPFGGRGHRDGAAPRAAAQPAQPGALVADPRARGAGRRGRRGREPRGRAARRVRPGALDEASNYITAHLAGRTLAEAAQAMLRDIASGRSALDAASRDLVERGLAVWSEDAARRPVLIVRGQANLLDETALGDLERVRSCSTIWKTSSRSPNCSTWRAKPMRPGFSSGRRTGCSRCRARR